MKLTRQVRKPEEILELTLKMIHILAWNDTLLKK